MLRFVPFGNGDPIADRRASRSAGSIVGSGALKA